MSEIKRKLIEEYLASPHKVGDSVNVIDDKGKGESATITKINDDGVFVKHSYSNYRDDKPYPADRVEKKTINIGFDPFTREDYYKKITFLAYSLESVLNTAGYSGRERKMKNDSIPELDWNPYVLDKNRNKLFYQRGFVWSLKDKQLLIETIYNHGNIGTFIFRRNNATKIFRDHEKGLETRAFHDIIDGKQRLNAIIGFIQNEFSDLNGNYFSDFSELAQRTFFNYSSMSTGLVENVSDDEVLKIFLRVNFTGVQMSQEHIDYVRTIELK